VPRRSRSRRQHRVTYTDGQFLHLQTGADFFGDGFGVGAGFDRDAAAQAWAVLREEILVSHVAERPCSRPWAWWEFDGRPPRRIVRAPREKCPEPARPYPWDRPCDFWVAWCRAPWLESQARYLKRHDLLTRHEVDILADHPELLAPVNSLESHRR
jgi:hypothetical protein